MRVAAVQMNTGDDVAANLAQARQGLEASAAAGAQLAALPENFAFMGSHDRAKLAHAEPFEDGPIQRFLSASAAALNLTVVAGTVPVAVPGDPERVFPAQLVYGPDGALLARYDKIHLFDVRFVNAQGREEQYRESAHFARGVVEPVVVETPVGRLGLSICYDLRFPELYRALSAAGAQLLTVPAAFTYTTGQAHWSLLLRARAVENQCVVIAPAQCGEHPGGRRTWGHSMIVGPWGEVLAEREEPTPGIAVAEFDPEALEQRRQQFPVLSHRRLI